MSLSPTIVRAAPQRLVELTERFQDLVLVEPPSRFGTDRFADMTPDRLTSILRQAAAGQFDQWVDFCDKMLDIDEHLAGLVETRTALLAGRPVVVAAAEVPAEQKGIAEAAAAFVRESFARVSDLDVIFADLLYGTFVGLAGAEHTWENVGGRWYSRPEWVNPRYLRWGPEWQVQVQGPDRRWHDAEPAKFILHAPRTRSTVPTKTGLLRSCSWVWLFKYWAWTFWVNGAERLANPLMLAKVPRNAPDAVRDTARAGLESLSADQAAVIENEVGIEFPPVRFADSSEVWKDLIGTANASMSKRILGSTLNVEVGDTGGNRAAAESQADVTIGPRIAADERQLRATITRDWIRPLLAFNRGLFGGRMPPVPVVSWPDPRPQKVDPTILAWLVNTRSIRRNQLLDLAGMPRIPADQGGEEFVEPPAAAPAFGRAELDRDGEDAPSYGRVVHETGGAWRAVDADGNSLGVFTTKAEAVARLNDHEAAAAREESAAPRPFVPTSTTPDPSATAIPTRTSRYSPRRLRTSTPTPPT